MKDKKKQKKTTIEIATPDEVAEFGRDDSAKPSAPPQLGDGTATAATQAEPDNAETEPQTDLQRAERERDEYKDKWLRVKAESQNQARRLQADRKEAVRYANADFARSLLTVVDDLERSLAAANQDADTAALAEGVRIVYDHLLKVLSDHHVEVIEAVGQPFDPTCHEALTQQPSADYPSGTVLQEAQKGYRLHERVLRPARVIVSCEPSQAEQPDEGEQTEAESEDDNKE